MKVAIIICMILSMMTLSLTISNDRKYKFDFHSLFALAALIMFLIRG